MPPNFQRFLPLVLIFAVLVFVLPALLRKHRSSGPTASTRAAQTIDAVRLIAQAGIEPEIGVILPMERAEEGIRAMWEGRTHGKTVFTR